MLSFEEKNGGKCLVSISDPLYQNTAAEIGMSHIFRNSFALSRLIF